MSLRIFPKQPCHPEPELLQTVLNILSLASFVIGASDVSKNSLSSIIPLLYKNIGNKSLPAILGPLAPLVSINISHNTFPFGLYLIPIATPPAVV